MPSKAKKVVESVPVTPVVVEEAAKTVKSKVVDEPKKVTKSKSKIPEPVQQTVVTPTPEPVVLDNVVVKTDTDETAVVDSFGDFLTKFQTLMTGFSSLKTELKALEKTTIRQLKVVKKLSGKKKRKGTRAPSGFVKPSPISDELAAFLGKDKGVEMARTDVTREINNYIKANNLQDKQNGRKINPDTALCKLLNITDEINLTYFNLQRYMGPHFPKSAKNLLAATA
jgi:upstream activation factor subunit UAF30